MQVDKRLCKPLMKDEVNRNFWVCPDCETENFEFSNDCIVCGCPRSEIWKYTYIDKGRAKSTKTTTVINNTGKKHETKTGNTGSGLLIAIVLLAIVFIIILVASANADYDPKLPENTDCATYNIVTECSDDTDYYTENTLFFLEDNLWERELESNMLSI